MDKAPIISLVVAVAENGVIGRDGGLPWHIPSDLKTFRRVTMGKPLIMGRRTYDSIGRPLDGRDNIVVSRDAAFKPVGVLVARSLDEARGLGSTCAANRGADEIMVIGGADIFAALLPEAARVYWTRVEGSPDGDARFPAFDWSAWRIVSEEPLPRGPKDEYGCRLMVLERRTPVQDSSFGGAGPQPAA